MTHYNVLLNGKYLGSRNELIEILKRICEKHEIELIEPAKVFHQHSKQQSDIIDNDLRHYTTKGHQIMDNYLKQYLKNI